MALLAPISRYFYVQEVETKQELALMVAIWS
jgi:hypothetical protein